MAIGNTGVCHDKQQTTKQYNDLLLHLLGQSLLPFLSKWLPFGQYLCKSLAPTRIKLLFSNGSISFATFRATTPILFLIAHVAILLLHRDAVIEHMYGAVAPYGAECESPLSLCVETDKRRDKLCD